MKSILKKQKEIVAHILRERSLFSLLVSTVLVLSIALAIRIAANSFLSAVLCVFLLGVAEIGVILFWLASLIWYRKLFAIVHGHHESVLINCKTISFLHHSVKRRQAGALVGITIIDHKNQKYLYIFPKTLASASENYHTYETLCIGKVLNLDCYQGTKVVRELAPAHRKEHSEFCNDE